MIIGLETVQIYHLASYKLYLGMQNIMADCPLPSVVNV